MSKEVALDGVSETMLVTLFYRAMETRSDAPLITDPKAVEIVDSLDYDFSRCTNWANQVCMAVRTRLFQDAIKAFIDEHPDAVVVNLAAGLDNRFSEMDNGSIRWFDLDLPAVIETRRQFIEETDRRKFLAMSALDKSWLDMLEIDDPSTPVLVVAEGLLPYLPEIEVVDLLATVADRFPVSRTVFEIFASFVVGREWIVTEFRNIRPKPRFLWSPYNALDMNEWDERFNILAVENLLDHYPEKWRFLWYISRLSRHLRNALGNRVITMDLNR